MKYLTTIAVVNNPILQIVLQATSSAKPTLTYHAYRAGIFWKKDAKVGPPRSVETILRNALDREIDRVCFFRMLMDDWDAPHRNLLPWLRRHRPAATSSWNRFIKMGFLVLLPGAGKAFLPRPYERSIRALAARFPMEDYALTDFVSALYAGLVFHTAAHLPMILTARCIGSGMGDEEYGGIPPKRHSR